MSKSGAARSGISGKGGPDPIAIGLQQLFAPLAAEPIPDEFMALLDRIDAKARDLSTRTNAGDQGIDDRNIGDVGAKR